jgi:GT2 family glycosyltransferase
VAAPLITVVIPTHNRVDALLRLLRALDRQEPVSGGFDVVVVADGCTDNTAARAQQGDWGFPLHVLEQQPSGPATARNCGAALAAGEILLFLDDDVEPEPVVLQEHAAFHAATPRALGIGYLPPVVDQRGLFGLTLRGWWESMFDGPRLAGHRYTWQNVLTGHLSVPRSLFAQLGGFDPALRCHEDYEFGYRAIEAGATVRFLADAVAWHHETTDLARAFTRKLEEGHADVQLATRHPELVGALPLARTPAGGRKQRVLVRLAWRSPRLGDALARLLVPGLAIYERWRLRFRWRALLEALLVYWYWRGVAQAIGSRARLDAVLAEPAGSAGPELTIDLSEGLPAAEQRLDARRPRTARLVYGDRLVGEIEPRPGAEPLRGVHLRPLLARTFAARYLRALALEHQMPEPLATAFLQFVPPAASAGQPEAFAA